MAEIILERTWCATLNDHPFLNRPPQRRPHVRIRAATTVMT